ncbi:MAG: hypothetical protein LBM96_01570 [Methanobrevibacter sp.]|jgi:hypothetical protein|nr:hypothetical protein [Candidatus Methanoflexus mossambicus]
MSLIETKLNFEDYFLKEIEIEAEKEGSTLSEYIKDAVKSKLESNKSETIEEKVKRLSNGKIRVMEKPNIPEEYRNIKIDDIIGLGSVPPEEEPFDVVEIVRKVDEGV